VKRLFATLATIGRLALPYFRSEDRWPGRLLLGAVIAIELSIVASVATRRLTGTSESELAVALKS